MLVSFIVFFNPIKIKSNYNLIQNLNETKIIHISNYINTIKVVKLKHKSKSNVNKVNIEITR